MSLDPGHLTPAPVLHPSPLSALPFLVSPLQTGPAAGMTQSSSHMWADSFREAQGWGAEGAGEGGLPTLRGEDH